MYFLMGCLILIWSFDYIVAKNALETFEPLTLLYLKYLVGLLLMVLIKQYYDRSWKLRKKDILTLIACSIFGEILYFYCEYSAMSYLPVSLITILLSFVPAVSIVLEVIIYKVNPTKKLIAGVGFSIFGVVLIIGVDWNVMLDGRIIGYLLAFGAIFSWNAYNFITASLHKEYSSISLTVMQLTCTIIMLTPYIFVNMPSSNVFTPSIIGGIMYLGVFGAGLGFLIQVKALNIIGPTIASLFSNFMPVTTTILGWFFLKETITLLQMAGGIIVIASGYFVIKEKGKVEELLK